MRASATPRRPWRRSMCWPVWLEIAAMREGAPELSDEDVLAFLDAGLHPIVDANLPRGEFVPNDVRLSDDDASIAILTWPKYGR
ncbi:MAG: hypothetical protein M9890_03715 [Thermomicrobiales bacterium]|nr:hypothetical protein [Thermomicrobiales bacterium]